MTKNTKTEAIIVRVSPDLKADLQKLADADMRKLSDYVRMQLVKLVNKTTKA
ncbi:MAG: hypothetical protein HOP10_03135 [Chitinophagaceae bacterium]|nr:hypothetical protein [Chitinophagaceae bacterium]